MTAIRTNEFALKIATVNGTGSASANGLLMKSMFRMGVPVSGKNVFPSNIQGLPTWYEIRVDARGHIARTPDFDLMVAMNPSTYARDVAELRSGGWLLYDSSWPLPAALERPDINFIGIPLASMCNEAFQGGRARLLLRNIAYVGALAALLDIDRPTIAALIDESYGTKKKLIDANYEAIRLGYYYVKDNFDCPLPIRLAKMPPPDDKILIDGNTAAALGCLYAGATVGAWYPITPATSLMDAFTNFCHEYRKDAVSGKNKYLIVQAEDELAAAGVVVGAGWAGARAFTPTAGPGISLMSEFIGLAYYAEIPAVFFDIQRTGPSTGMPTRTQQGDLMLCAYASHGDTKHILLFPSDPAEAFEMAVTSFDLAERFQSPTFVVSDLDIGMNDWIVPKLKWDDSYRPDRGKVLTDAQLEKMQTFYRYLDEDGSGVAARTLPGSHPKGAYFTRGSGHNKFGGYTEDADEYIEVVDRLKRKIDSAANAVPAPVIHTTPGADVGIISIGGCDRAVLEAMERFSARGMPVDYLRVRGFPFNQQVRQFIESHDKVFVLEQNRDAQLRSMIALETGISTERMHSVLRYGGLPMSAVYVEEGVLEGLGTGAMVPGVDAAPTGAGGNSAGAGGNGAGAGEAAGATEGRADG